jgi:protein-S-isoprenylcysteine O-methyltransferase Ste14
MNIWDRYAEFIYKIATGDKRRRNLITAVAPLVFYAITAIVIFAAYLVDKRLALPFFGFSYSWWRIAVSVLLIALGCAIAGWTYVAFGRTRGTPIPFSPPPKLVTTGLYAHVRNPMFIGGFLVLEGFGVMFGLLSLIFVFAPLLMLFYAFYVNAVEEKELEMKFGKEYVEYKKRVPMFIPRLGRNRKNSRLST